MPRILTTKRMALLLAMVMFSAWFPNSIAKSEKAGGQAELLSSNSTFSSINKETGLPYPGTYTLQKIFAVPKQTVLDTNSKLQPISKYTKGKITLLTFFYEGCSDAKGCPYALGVFHNVKSSLEKTKGMEDLIRLVHISFDPDRDTPMMLKGLEKRMLSSNKKGIEWDFLTTSSVNALIPLIDGFGQNVDINLNPYTGSKLLTYQHVLKVYLIDQDGFVREIYSTAYLSKEMVLNDIKTLLMEQNAKRKK